MSGPKKEGKTTRKSNKEGKEKPVSHIHPGRGKDSELEVIESALGGKSLPKKGKMVYC